MAAPTHTVRAAWSIASTSIALPFDTTGAVGPDSVFCVSKQGVDCYTKEGTQLWEETLRNFFGLGGSPFDPRIVYDPVAERFFIVAVDGKAADADDESNLLIAVSTSANPTSSDSVGSVPDWNILTEDVSQGGLHWLDYPLIGFDADVVTIGGVLFPQTGEAQNWHSMVYVIPKSDLTAETPTLDNLATLEIDADTNKDFAHPVSDLDNGSLPHTLWMWDEVTQLIERYDVTLNGSYSADRVATIAYTDPIGVDGEQPDGSVDLDNFVKRRVGTSPVRVGGFDYLVLASQDGTGNDATIVVLKIDVTEGSSDLNTIVAKTILHESGLDLLFPSIAVNSSGHIVIGCTSTGAGVGDYAGAMIFVGQDDGATMTFASGEIVKTGQRDYENVPDGEVRNRWGDYSATVVDPLSPTRFWTFQSWAWDNTLNDAGRKMEVTEVITTPSGVFDLFGWTMGWRSAGEALITADKMFKLKASQTYIDGIENAQTYVDGVAETDTYVDGAVQTQTSC